MSSLARLTAHVKQLSRCFCVCKDVHRTLLSEAYKCENLWMDRLSCPVLSKVNLNDFIVKVYNQSDGGCTKLDMDIIASKLNEVMPSDIEIFKNILKKFRSSSHGKQFPRLITHAIVRNFIELQLTDSLLEIMHDKTTYGLHLDFISANILMDYFIKKDMYNEASKVAYEMMLQEDFSNKATYLLSLYATTKLLYNPVIVVEEQAGEEEESSKEGNEEDEEDIKYVRVKVIQFPYFDDHFSIRNEKFLHGKTLYMLGKLYGGIEGRSLQFIGLGMYNKFPKAFNLLKTWMAEIDGEIIVQDMVSKFDEALETCETRDPEEKKKPLGLLRIEDEIHFTKPTTTEKEEFVKEWEELKGKLQSENKLSSKSLEDDISEYVKNELPKHEEIDCDSLKDLFNSASDIRQKELDDQIKAFKKKQKQEEIQQKLMEMQEKEELYAYYQYQNEIKLAAMTAPEPYPEPPEKDDVIDDEEDEKTKKRASKKKM